MYVEKISSLKEDSVELEHAIKAATKGDLFVLYKLDWLARSTKEVFKLTGDLNENGVEFVSINDAFDTTTPTGKAMFGMLAVFAEFERDIIQQRTKAGLESARQRRRVGGRPSIDNKTKKRVKALFEAGESANNIAKEYGIDRANIYKILKKY